jgi:hypothetical protein
MYKHLAVTGRGCGRRSSLGEPRQDKWTRRKRVGPTERRHLLFKNEKVGLTLEDSKNLLGLMDGSNETPSLASVVIQHRLQLLGIECAGETSSGECVNEVSSVGVC